MVRTYAQIMNTRFRSVVKTSSFTAYSSRRTEYYAVPAGRRERHCRSVRCRRTSGAFLSREAGPISVSGPTFPGRQSGPNSDLRTNLGSRCDWERSTDNQARHAGLLPACICQLLRAPGSIRFRWGIRCCQCWWRIRKSGAVWLWYGSCRTVGTVWGRATYALRFLPRDFREVQRQRLLRRAAAV